MDRIPVFAPYIGVDTLKHLTDSLDVGWLGMGATTKEFEERIQAFLETDRTVVATNTGTSALHIALIAAGVKDGDEVIVPSFDYVADHQAILLAGGVPVMCDIRDDDLGIDTEKAEALITDRTRAIIPLHFAGLPCNLKAVYALAEKYGLRVVEDAMHAFGTRIDGERIGSFGDICTFSFDPVKIITSIDGGCVVLNNPEEAEHLRRMRFLGVDKETTLRYKNKRSWDYDVLCDGFRYHMTNVMASVGVSQIKRAEEFIGSRQKVCQAYNEAFSPFPDARIPKTDFVDISPFIYSLRVLNGRRGELIAHLDERGIDVGIHFIPVHKHTHFESYRCGNMSVTDKVVEEVLTLPLHSLMSQGDIDRVVDGVTSFFQD